MFVIKLIGIILTGLIYSFLLAHYIVNHKKPTVKLLNIGMCGIILLGFGLPFLLF